MALDGVGGLLVVGAALTWRPNGWLLFLNAGLCFAAFGIWGAADRELTERQAGSGAVLLGTLRMVRVLAAAIGSVAVVALLLIATAFALGPFIS